MIDESEAGNVRTEERKTWDSILISLVNQAGGSIWGTKIQRVKKRHDSAQAYSVENTAVRKQS